MPEAFHFLRPLWLLGLVPCVGLLALLLRDAPEVRRWRGVIDPHLLEHLIVRPADTAAGLRARLTAPLLIPISMALASLAAAGPTWEREPSPFAQDTAPLIVVLELTPGMHAKDVAPSRLERAKHKLRDLLAARPGARTGLVVYAGSAHLVLPPTEDAQALTALVDSLTTELMPVEGNDAAGALALALDLLSREEAAGTLVFVGDGIPRAQAPAFRGLRSSRHALAVLALGRDAPTQATTPGGERIDATLDLDGLTAVADAGGGDLVRATVDSADVEQIARSAQRNLEQRTREDAGGRWLDRGYYLAWPMAFLALLWFRRGVRISWETAL
jgi:Ca-activated chloride channel homolog